MIAISHQSTALLFAIKKNTVMFSHRCDRFFWRINVKVIVKVWKKHFAGYKVRCQAISSLPMKLQHVMETQYKHLYKDDKNPGRSNKLCERREFYENCVELREILRELRLVPYEWKHLRLAPSFALVCIFNSFYLVKNCMKKPHSANFTIQKSNRIK